MCPLLIISDRNGLTTHDSKADRMSPGRTMTCVLVMLLFVFVLWIRGTNAQRPERQHEFRLPRSGVVLKEGWQLLIYDGCRFPVPEHWQPNVTATFVLAPDGSSVSIGRLRTMNWFVHKAQLKAAFPQLSVVHEDSDLRLWFEVRDGQRVHHYIDVLTGQSVCSAHLDIHSTTMPNADEIARTIVTGLQPALTAWP